MSRSPYSQVPSRGFWKTGVAGQNPQNISDIYRSKFAISRGDAIATAGSCFAQHIARHLRQRKFKILQYEPAPRGMRAESARKYGFGLYSCRYGNIYTAAQMLQLAQEAFGRHIPADRVWENNGRYFDSQRPNVEPGGFETADQVLMSRERHLANVRRMLLEMDVLVFTFGLTETWVHTDSGTVFPTAPGTIAGSFDEKKYRFHNFSYSEVLRDFVRLKRLLKRARERKRKLRYIVTVSPVPLTATATGEHVLVASTYSKSVLRSVTGELMQTHRDVDYFPSYELITAPVTRGIFFEPNQRGITEAGVNTAMSAFLAEHDPQSGNDIDELTENSALPANSAPSAIVKSDEEIVCEEAMLEAFQT